MNLKGYIFSRPFLGERAPQHVQNIVIKDYCTKNKFNLFLSATEYERENSTHILKELILNINKYDGLIFYSLLQLPINKKERFDLYKIITKENKSLHFAVENIKLKNKNDLEQIEKIFNIKIAILKGKLKNNHVNLKKFISKYHKKTDI